MKFAALTPTYLRKEIILNNYKYKLVQSFILNFIYENRNPGKRKIPSERMISQQLGVSRTTVKYAIDKLIKDRVLYKEHGKGTFVNFHMNFSRIEINKKTPDAFTLNVKGQGLELGNIVLSLMVLYDYEDLKNIFPKEIVDFYELKRIRIVNKNYFSVEISYFPFRQFPDANRYDFSKKSLYQYLENKGHKPVHFTKSIEVVENAEIRSLLKLQPEVPMFFEKYKAYSQQGQLVEYTKVYTDSRLVEYGFSSI